MERTETVTAADPQEHGFERLYLQPFRPVPTPEQVAAEVACLIKLLKLGTSAPVLNLSCGPGQHALELARRGFSVTGLDSSEEFLAEARHASETAGIPVTWIRRELQRIPFRGIFDAVVTSASGFGCSPSIETDRAILHAAYRALRPGGQVLLEVVNRERLVRDFIPRRWSEADGIRVLEDQQWDLLTNELRARWVFLFPDRRELTRTSLIRVHPAHEIAALFRETGFSPVTAYGDFDGQPFTLTSPRLILVGRRADTTPEAPAGVSLSHSEPF
jgi:SAM-dependent methyltransferase